MTKKKIYRTVIQVEILSDTPYSECPSLDEILYDIDEGDCSGLLTTITSNEELVGMDAIKVIEGHGSDPEFFQMDGEGNDLDEMF